MADSSRHRPRAAPYGGTTFLTAALVLSVQVPGATAVVYPSFHDSYIFNYLGGRPKGDGRQPVLARRNADKPIPLIATNNCPDTVWPGVGTQFGQGPDNTGFPLAPGETKKQTVSSDWAGRLWGRTNCTVSDDNETATCATGDCGGLMQCQFGGATPATLAEFNLAGGETGTRTFYDISLVDGYNLPIGLLYHPAANTTDIPPNLVNAACIGTPGYLTTTNRTGLYYTNFSYPMPYERSETNDAIRNWCPWDMQLTLPQKPGDGVYPYPDDNVVRPTFNPCKSACAATNKPRYCCTGEYHSPEKCHKNDYSIAAKAMCPDAYSFAFDDQTSTFIIPSGGGFEVIFCPAGRSTDILATFGDQLRQIAASGSVTDEIRRLAMNRTFINSKMSSRALRWTASGLTAAVVALMAGAALL